MYYVTIRDRKTCDVSRTAINLPWDESSEFWWSEGNFSCDCNRGDVFHDGMGIKRRDYPCVNVEFPNGRFEVVSVELEGGSVVYGDRE